MQFATVPNTKGEHFDSLQQASERPAFVTSLEKLLCYGCFSHYATGMKF